MIREFETAELGAFCSPVPMGRLSPPAPVAAPMAAEKVEQEIARLTWSVLDGSASLTDRQRLAELVRAQHELRRPLASSL